LAPSFVDGHCQRFSFSFYVWQKIFKSLSQPDRNAILTDGISDEKGVQTDRKTERDQRRQLACPVRYHAISPLRKSFRIKRCRHSPRLTRFL
jgi:hypothetical protein